MMPFGLAQPLVGMPLSGGLAAMTCLPLPNCTWDPAARGMKAPVRVRYMPFRIPKYIGARGKHSRYEIPTRIESSLAELDSSVQDEPRP